MAVVDWVVSAPDPDVYGGGTNLVDDGGFLSGVVVLSGPEAYQASAASLVNLDEFGWSMVIGLIPMGFVVAPADLSKIRRHFHYRPFPGDATRGPGHPALGTLMSIEDAGAAGLFRETPQDTDLHLISFYAFVVGLARRKFTLAPSGLVLPED